MQSTNEELDTAKEELQSTNEELHSVNEELFTVNSEYQKKISELNELNRDMLSHRLGNRNVQMSVTKDSASALAILEKQEFSLMLLNVMMPKLSGFDVCSRTKQTLGLKDVYIVLLTAKGQEFDRQRGQEVGADLMAERRFADDDAGHEGAERQLDRDQDQVGDRRPE